MIVGSGYIDYIRDGTGLGPDRGPSSPDFAYLVKKTDQAWFSSKKIKPDFELIKPKIKLNIKFQKIFQFWTSNS